MLVAVYHGIYFIPALTKVGHAHNPLSALLYEGNTGVALFCVISGFLFSYGAEGRDFDTRDFWRNRFLRIYPLFFFIQFIAIYAYPKKFDALAVLLNLIGFANASGSAALNPLTAQFWTIAVECQFYALFPLLLAMYRKRGISGLCQLLALALVVRLVCAGLGAKCGDLAYWTLLGRIDQFLLGMIAAVIFRRHPLPQAVAVCGALALAACVSSFLLISNHCGGVVDQAAWRTAQPLVEGGLWASFLVCYINAARKLPRWPGLALEWVGARSYSMYLLNVAGIEICIRQHWILFPRSGPFASSILTMLIVCIPLLIALSTLTYNLVELPFLGLRRKYLGQAAV